MWKVQLAIVRKLWTPDNVDGDVGTQGCRDGVVVAVDVMASIVAVVPMVVVVGVFIKRVIAVVVTVVVTVGSSIHQLGPVYCHGHVLVVCMFVVRIDLCSRVIHRVLTVASCLLIHILSLRLHLLLP